MAKNSSPSRAPKKWCSTWVRTDGARKCRISLRKTRPSQNERQLRDHHSFLHSEPPGICRCTPTGMSTQVSRLQRAAAVGSRLSPHSLHPRSLLDMHNQGRRTPCQWTATGRISVVCSTEPRETASAPRQGCQRPGPKIRRAALWDLDCLPQLRTNLLDQHNKHRPPCQLDCNWGISVVC